MLQALMQAVDKSFFQLTTLAVYLFLFIIPAITVGNLFIKRLPYWKEYPAEVAKLLFSFIVFSFPTLIIIVLYLRSC